MANEQPPEEFDEQPSDESVEQRINNDHSGVFSVLLPWGEFYERDNCFPYDDDMARAGFDPLSFNGLCDSINCDIFAFSHPGPTASPFGSESPPKRDHDLILKLLELLEEHNTSAEADRSLVLAVQLGMAYQRLLLRPAEEMAKAAWKTEKQRMSLSKKRQKITPDKACELCEQIQGENEGLDVRSVAKRAAARFKAEGGPDVSSETIRKLWLKNRKKWRKCRAEEMRYRECRMAFEAKIEAKIKAKHMRPPDSSSTPEGG